MSVDLKKFVALHFVIQPVLFIISLIDYLKSLFAESETSKLGLPDKNGTFSALTDEKDSTCAYRSTLCSDLIRLDDANANLYGELANVINLYKHKKTLGVRQIISAFDQKQSNGKVFKKYSLGDYKWSTYEEVFAKINSVSNGLLNIGLKSDQNVIFFAETRAEWLMSAFACFR